MADDFGGDLNVDLIDRARNAVADRAELPGMSLMQHLEELRKMLLHSAAAITIGMCVAYFFNEQLRHIIFKPLLQMGLQANILHPTDGLNFAIKTALYGGILLAVPYVLYQVWLFIAPGLYTHEKRYVVPFMAATVGLFFTGAFLAYRFVLPAAMPVLLGHGPHDFGKDFASTITIEDYMNFFLSVILGLGITFELPIVIFFLSLFGIVDAGFLWRNARYAILLIFIVSAVICPLPDPISMCIFASPLLLLYGVSIGVAYVFHPKRQEKKLANS
ncbi:MAG TPA: twin-arginine translocase subunit TatC [Acidobacteriaceae bacterium]|jgi:sec-independent protein translocase protein TatC|nr:twin-arginine translocase subunit TatC [Acidobacteriaceae bacterium]